MIAEYGEQLSYFRFLFGEHSVLRFGQPGYFIRVGLPVKRTRRVEESVSASGTTPTSAGVAMMASSLRN
jgi:hypothetical protein